MSCSCSTRSVPSPCALPRSNICFCITHTHTLMDMRTDLTAVPHASLRNPNPERSRKVLKSLGVFKRKRGQKLKTGPIRQGDVVPCVTANAVALYKRKKNGHLLRLTMRPGAPSRYLFTTAWMGLRWPMPSKCPWAPCLKQNENNSKESL